MKSETQNSVNFAAPQTGDVHGSTGRTATDGGVKPLERMRMSATGKAYRGLAAHFQIRGVGDVIVIGKDAYVLQSLADRMGSALDVSMAKPVVVFGAASATPLAATKEPT